MITLLSFGLLPRHQTGLPVKGFTLRAAVKRGRLYGKNRQIALQADAREKEQIGSNR